MSTQLASSRGAACGRRFRLRGLALAALASLAACARAPIVEGPVADAECSGPVVAIAAVQGSGERSPMLGEVVTVEGLVTHAARAPNGVFVETPTGLDDRDPATSDALFVAFDGDAPAPGTKLRVRGTVAELGGGAATATTVIADEQVVCGTASLAPATVLAAAPRDWESHESARVRLPGPLTVTGNFGARSDGTFDLSFEGRLWQPTEHLPVGAEAQALAQRSAHVRFVLDDFSADPLPFERPGMLAHAQPWRTGTQVFDIHALVDERDGTLRLQRIESPQLRTEQAPRPPPPPLPSGIRVAAFNLLNFFNGDGAGGGYPTLRGARDDAAKDRQRDKLVAAVVALAPDVAALMEVENDGYGPRSAIAEFTRALNEKLGAEGDYRYIRVRGGRIGGDEISVAMVYRVGAVRPLGSAHVLARGAFARRSRVPLLQAFAPIAGGEPFAVVANHFKSKRCGQDMPESDRDRRDGQGCWNATRTAAARELAAWLARDPTGHARDATLIVGDLNAYGEEDPLRALRAAGYVDVIARYVGPEAYSFVYAGLSGRLDHALAAPALAPRVIGAAEWHINADESDAFAYWGPLFAPDPYRSSDHDPLIVVIRP